MERYRLRNETLTEWRERLDLLDEWERRIAADAVRQDCRDRMLLGLVPIGLYGLHRFLCWCWGITP